MRSAVKPGDCGPQSGARSQCAVRCCVHSPAPGLPTPFRPAAMLVGLTGLRFLHQDFSPTFFP